MSPSRIKKNQVYDADFLSETEHEVFDHTFIALVDTPATFSGLAGKYIKVNDEESALEYYTEGYNGEIEVIIDVDFNNSKVKKGYMIFEEGTLTTYSGSDWI